MTMIDTARQFFDACETGKGWSMCQAWCQEGATFDCQSDALADTKTLEAYSEWMKGLFGPLPDGQYELKSFAADPERNTVAACAVFRATHTGEGGPVPPTGKSVVSDYVYVMEFSGDKIRHITKVWNDVQALRGLGWA